MANLSANEMVDGSTCFVPYSNDGNYVTSLSSSHFYKALLSEVGPSGILLDTT